MSLHTLCHVLFSEQPDSKKRKLDDPRSPAPLTPAGNIRKVLPTLMTANPLVKPNALHAEYEDENDQYERSDPYTIACLKAEIPTPKAKARPVKKARQPASNAAKKMYVCTVASCGKEFSDRSGLRKHKKVKHSFKCPHNCGQVFTSLEGMFAHMHQHA
jgi:hypothetical protein